MSWFLTIIIVLFSFTFNNNNLSEARHQKKLPSAVVVGTVYCDTCFQDDFSKTSHFISGALVAVECGGTSNSKPSFREEVKTNEHGEFRVSLPFSVSKHVKKIKNCSVKLISSSEPYCAVASSATSSSSIHLKSKNQGTHIFSAGFFTFKPLKQPTLCNQKPSVHNPNEFNSKKPLIFPPPIQDPETPSLSPLPALPRIPPLPQLPPLPHLPGFPNFPPTAKKSVSSKTEYLKTTELSNGKVSQQLLFSPIPQIPILPSPPAFGLPIPPDPFKPPSTLPPNPFQPPPSILPPNPLQPPSILPPNPFQPPPSILPPNPLQPPPSSVFPPNPVQPSPPGFNLPPIPGLTPPSPAPPVFGIPLPPLPFIPSPTFPGIPPASTKKTSP